MGRRRDREDTDVSLFPFLSILACIIGVLTLLISTLALSQMDSDVVVQAEEYESVESEVMGSWVDRRQFRELYEFAVSAHGHGFLCIKLKSKNPLKMFAADFNRWLHPS